MSRLCAASAAALWLTLFVLRALAASPAAPAAASPMTTRESAVRSEVLPQSVQKAGYAGQETCVTCHEGFDVAVNRSKHGFARDPRSPAAAQGCETCHGPAEAHTQDPEQVKPPRVFSRMAPRAVSETCTTCHNRGDHALWDGSAHDQRNISCASCHSVHTPKSERGQLKAANLTAQCATCHRDKVNKLDRSGHMPLREGKMDCMSCHNVHGSKNVRLLRAGFTVNEACSSCHADKRGPFLWEHSPVRDSCTTCHDPHGSSNERMLVAKQPFLCQRCHNHTKHPSTIYDNKVVQSSNRLFSRSCVTCHAAIHGSNHPSGSTFLRQ
jgi:DmsE family decaheme c-type cytochrome